MTNMKAGDSQASCVFSLFWDFNRLVGKPVRRVYVSGLAVIAVAAAGAIGWALAHAVENPGAGADGFFAAAALIGIGFVVWRFACALAVGLSLRRA